MFVPIHSRGLGVVTSASLVQPDPVTKDETLWVLKLSKGGSPPCGPRCMDDSSYVYLQKVFKKSAEVLKTQFENVTATGNPEVLKVATKEELIAVQNEAQYVVCQCMYRMHIVEQ